MTQDSQEKQTARKAEGRSPSWPAIPLDEAIERTRIIFDAEKRHATSRDVMFQHWGYSPKSGNARQTAAAVRSFGLIEPVGDNWKITDDAWKILIDPDKSSLYRFEIIKKLALLPKIHAELWNKYGKELPSDANIKRYLVMDRGFNSNGVDDFIKQYKRTISFSGLLNEVETETDIDKKNSIVEVAIGHDDLIYVNRDEDIKSNAQNVDHIMPSIKQSEQGYFSMSLNGGNFLEIKLRNKLEPEEFDEIFTMDLIRFIRFSLSKKQS